MLWLVLAAISIGIGTACFMCALVALVTERNESRFNGFMAIAYGLYSIALMSIAHGLSSIFLVRFGCRIFAGISAGMCAWCAYDWWHGGGGDETKRRLRSIRRRFTGARRTAPQHA